MALESVLLDKVLEVVLPDNTDQVSACQLGSKQAGFAGFVHVYKHCMHSLTLASVF